MELHNLNLCVFDMDENAVINHIVDWLDQYLLNSGLDGFVVGVSGGIDSAVTSTLCALTGKPVLCLDMPIHQERGQMMRSEKHIGWLKHQFSNVEGKRVDLTSVYDAFAKSVNADKNNETTNLALANTRSRLRMTTLYQFATEQKKLVAGTGNKVEDFGIGFYTKYGDGGVDLSPIADLMKSQVYALARHLNIIDEIIEAPPTDGLWDDNRTDEQQIGASYDDMEWAMKQVESGKTPEDFSGSKKNFVEIYLRHHNKNKHKMKPIPVCFLPSLKKNS
ncbi:MAG: NAD(+) synthase [Cryomorphaceae bacterium]|nr:NAD(+) synthase [Cryomorphaceae bacterium]